MFRRRKSADGEAPIQDTGSESADPGRAEESTEQRDDAAGQLAPDGAAGPGTDDPGPGDAGNAVFDRSAGPLDASEVLAEPDPESDADSDDRLDLGALRLLVPDDAEVRVEMDPDTNEPASVTMRRGDGYVQFRPVSAPRSGGLWDEIRAETIEEVIADGGSAEEYPGVFGMEVRTRLTGTDEEGTPIEQVIRFVGVDGPKWMLQGVFFGSAADPDQAAGVDDLFRSAVVVRGDQAMPPRRALPISVPESARILAGADQSGDPGSGAGSGVDGLQEDFEDFEREFSEDGADRVYTGPTDIDDADETEPRLEMGSLEIPVEQELDITLEVDPDTGEPGAVMLVRGQGGVQVRPFSALGTDDLWSRARKRIMAEISKDGGLVDERQGPFGTELLAQVPAEDEEGKSFLQPIRIVGFNGNDWLLQGVFLGEGVDPEAAGDLENIFRSVVVDPGERDVPLGHPLPITAPQNVVEDELAEEDLAEPDGVADEDDER